VAPMYFSLFGLMRDSDHTWLPPNHVFNLDPSANERVLFRVRWVAGIAGSSVARCRAGWS